MEDVLEAFGGIVVGGTFGLGYRLPMRRVNRGNWKQADANFLICMVWPELFGRIDCVDMQGFSFRVGKSNTDMISLSREI